MIYLLKNPLIDYASDLLWNICIPPTFNKLCPRNFYNFMSHEACILMGETEGKNVSM